MRRRCHFSRAPGCGGIRAEQWPDELRYFQSPHRRRPAATSQETDPLKRPLTDAQKKANAKAFQKEISKTYKKWLDEDVRWIITDEERSAFKQLSNDDERDQFIEQFWLRRDPTPDTVENEYKEEHYRRIAYANEHFAAGIPGWKTDRGRIYIMYGPADSMETHPTGGFYERPAEEGGGALRPIPLRSGITVTSKASDRTSTSNSSIPAVAANTT